MKKVELEELNNGYWVKLSDRDYDKELVYTSLQHFEMIIEIAKFLFGYRIKVERV